MDSKKKRIKNDFYARFRNQITRKRAAMFRSRLLIIDNLIKQDWAKGFFCVPDDMIVDNIIALRQLIIATYSIADCNKIRADNNNNIIDILLGQPGQGFTISDLQMYDLIKVDYEFSVDGYNMYFNINSHGPLLIRYLGNVTIYYREILPGELDDFLVNFNRMYGQELVYSEPIQLGFRSALSSKRFIITQLLGTNVADVNDDRITDMYNNIMRVSNCDLELPIDERRSIINEVAGRMRAQLNNEYYTNVVSGTEQEAYVRLIQELNNNLDILISSIRGKNVELPFNIKPYYNIDQRISERNKYKQDYNWVKRHVITALVYNPEFSSIVNDVHPDIVMSINIMLIHLDLLGLSSMYYKGSAIYHYFRKITSLELRRKPILIKFLIKESLDSSLHDLKERGYISMHQLENFFGYRMTKVIRDEVKKDYLEFFNLGREVNGKKQYEFIKKWFGKFLESRNYKGRIIADIMWANIRKYRSVDDILGSVTSYMHSKGTVDDVKIKTIDGKRRGISKNAYFNLIESQGEYKIRGNRRNKVIIKREEYIKQRIVINSTLDTFVPLSKINRVLSILTGATGIMYYSNSKQQKAEHYARLVSYLNYNKCEYPRWLCMPLDYSSYDHTITIDMIQAIIESVSDYFRIPELKQWFEEFRELLRQEVVYFDELDGDPDNNQHYKYGVLSGWKITSSIESIGNAIITFGVMQELGLALTDFETMGDDLIILLDKPRLRRDQQLEVLKLVCEKYESLGFIMNVPKNSVGYYFLEFLRVTFRPGLVQCYPSRIIGSMFYLKPGRSRLNFGADELLGVLNKVCKRYGCLNRKVEVARLISTGFDKQDVRLNFIGYVRNPVFYDVQRQVKEDFKYDVHDIDTPIYKRYIEIFGERFIKYILWLVRTEVITQKRIVTKLVKTHKQVYRPSESDLVFLAEVVKKYGHYVNQGESLFIYLPEYHMVTLMDKIMKPSHFLDLDDAKQYLRRVFNNMYKLGLIRAVDKARNILIINSVTDFLQLRLLFKNDKISIAEYNMPAIIMSRYKEVLKAGMVMMMGTEGGKWRQLIRLVLSRPGPIIRAVLGKLMNIRNELMGMYMNIPIGMMAD